MNYECIRIYVYVYTICTYKIYIVNVFRIIFTYRQYRVDK